MATWLYAHFTVVIDTHIYRPITTNAYTHSLIRTMGKNDIVTQGPGKAGSADPLKFGASGPFPPYIALTIRTISRSGVKINNIMCHDKTWFLTLTLFTNGSRAPVYTCTFILFRRLPFGLFIILNVEWKFLRLDYVLSLTSRLDLFQLPIPSRKVRATDRRQ